MISLRLIVCACVLLLIGIQAAPKPDPYWNWSGFPPSRDANPGPWNWNGFPPSRGDYPRAWNPWVQKKFLDKGYYPQQRNYNYNYNYNRGSDLERFDSNGCKPGYKR